MAGKELDGLKTEQVNPRTADLDQMSTQDMLLTINAEDARVADAVREVVPAIARAVDGIAERLAGDGRLHYFGAGTSGRLGVLDASECPPTFGVSKELVQGHIAGGLDALTRSIEGAEDSEEMGARDAIAAGVGSSDAVVGIAASGRTPYAIGALRYAADAKALTIAVVCNRPSPMHKLAQIVIDPVVGEEVLSGSTRLKSGTAQKMVLNMISTGVMIRLGHTYGNLMVGVRPTNEKLKVRAARLVSRITEAPCGVEDALEKCDWDVKCACVVLKRSVSPERARAILSECGGRLRDALGER